MSTKGYFWFCNEENEGFLGDSPLGPESLPVIPNPISSSANALGAKIQRLAGMPAFTRLLTSVFFSFQHINAFKGEKIILHPAPFQREGWSQYMVCRSPDLTGAGLSSVLSTYWNLSFRYNLIHVGLCDCVVLIVDQPFWHFVTHQTLHPGF